MKNLFKLAGEKLSNAKKPIRAIPPFVVVAFTLSVVMMNLMANKVIFRAGDYLAADGGLLLSWIPFLCMDVVVKRFGPKASNVLNVFAVAMNLCCVGVFALIAAMAGDGSDYSAFDATFSCTWFILLGSTLAMIVAALVNNGMNAGLTRLFKDRTSKKAYVVSSYVSTFVAQFVDNFVFAFVVFVVFAPIYWEGFEAFKIVTCLGCGVLGAVLELAMEVLFSPIGYRVIKKWEREGVGSNYFEEA